MNGLRPKEQIQRHLPYRPEAASVKLISRNACFDFVLEVHVMR
jgi:hypothetical protein